VFTFFPVSVSQVLTSASGPADASNDPSFENATVVTKPLRLATIESSEASAALRKAIELDPEEVEAYCSLGIVLAKQKKSDEAIAAFRKAIELDPEFAGAYISLGAVLSEQKKPDEAMAAFNRAIELDPKFAQAYINLGIVLFAQKKLDEAIAAYNRAIELEPENAGAYGNLGAALKQQNKLDEAIAAFRKVIEIDPKFAGAYINLGSALKQQKKLDEAIAAYNRAIEIDPKYAKAYINLGSALYEQQKLDEAVVCWKTVIRLVPKSPGVLNQIAWPLVATPDKDGNYPLAQQAVAWARRANGLAPDNGGLLNTLGVALYRAQQWQEAIDALQKSIEHGADTPHNWLFIAMAHWQLDQKDKAKQWYDKALAWQTANAANAKADAELQGFYAEAARLLKTELQPDKPEGVPGVDKSASKVDSK